MAESTKDYLTVYKHFFENFAKTVDPEDQLPVRVAGYRLWDNEVVGETVDWTLQYLSERNCPPSLLAPITRIVIDEIQQQCATQPLECGFNAHDKCYLPLKLMKAVTNKVNEVCFRFCDNGRVTSLPPPTPGPLISSFAVKNSRRCMEDRHVILEDFHAFFNIKDKSSASYYAVFDGHAGTDAAIYSVSHLHQFLAESPYYPTDPEKAIKDAFFRTDNLFIEKSNKENLRSGTTAVCALLRPEDKKLYVAWLGDSQAVLVRNCQAIQLVNPHKPDREDEMTRIQNMGGSVIYWGTWRVNGQLAVSRAIGDCLYKPYVTAEPDVKTINLTGDEDFIVLACDGLWDVLSAQDVLWNVVNQLIQDSGDLEAVSESLVRLSKLRGSTDNITVIVVFLRDPAQIALDSAAHTRRKWPVTMDEVFGRGPGGDADSTPPMEPSAAANPFAEDHPATALKASAPALFDVAPGSESAFVPAPCNNGHANGNLFDFLDHAADIVNATTNGKTDHDVDDDDEDDDDDSGADAGSGDAPDATHASLAQQPQNPFSAELEELQRQQTKEFDPEGEPARDTPTPPADEVPGVIGLVSDNVAESGEESEDEWNYYRAEPTGKSPQPAGEPEQQTKQEVCSEEPAKTEEETAEDMESQLNPNAAEFIPSPTHAMPSMEDFILSQGKNDVSMDDVIVPSGSEFEKEVSSRPSEVDVENSFFNSSLSSVNTSGLLEEQEKLLDECLTEHSKSQSEKFINPIAQELSDIQEVSVMLDESTAFSTKAEFGDESTTSFMAIGSDFQKITGVTGNTMESSLMGQDLLTSEEHMKETSVLENNVEADVEVTEENTTFQENLSDLQKEPVHISFELQKEIAPHMESEPERVKVDSVDDSPVEPDVQIENGLAVEDFVADNAEFSNQLGFTGCEFMPPKDDIPVFDNYMPEPVTQEQPDNDITSDVQSYQKTDDLVLKVDSFDIFNDFSKPLPDIAQPILDGVSESQTVISESIMMPEVDSPSEDFRENLSIQKESLNTLNNEISTPEYEKLEKVVEASEALMVQINMSRNNHPLDIHSEEESVPDTTAVEGVILESAHPDKTELLVDACAEPEPELEPDVTSVPTEPLDIYGEREAAQFDNYFSNVSEPLYSEASPPAPVLSESAPFEVVSSEIGQLSVSPIVYEESLLGKHETEFAPADSTSDEIEPPAEVTQASTLQETMQTPPPTPAVNQVVEPLDFDKGVDDLAQVIEKLAVTEANVSDQVNDAVAETSTSSISAAETVEEQMKEEPVIASGEVEGVVASTVAESSSLKEAEKGADVVGAAVAGVTVAAVATAAAVTVIGNKDSKKETSTKRTPTSITKKAGPEKSRTSSERPKTATRTTPVPTRLTSAAKTKSPTSPVKSPVAAKATTTKLMSTTLSKTTTATTKVSQSTKPATKPLSSSTVSATTAIKHKPSTAPPLTKPAVPRASTLKPKPCPTATEKKPLTNGDLKAPLKRPEQLSTKTAMRPTTRPATAPTARTATKPSSLVSSAVTKTKSSLLNGPSKPRPPSSVTSKTTTKSSTDKEIKESANKQISTRTSTTTVRSTITASTKSSVTPAPRKIESKHLANGRAPPAKPASMLSSSTASKVPPKRPATATRLKSTKTSTLVEKTETVQGSKTVVTTNDIKSEAVIDSTQTTA